GTDIRVTAQLIRASDGFQVWSENFDGSVEDAIAIQEQIARAIARSLETALDPAALEAMLSAGTTSVDAYEAYLRGREADRSNETARNQAALAYAQEAVTIDPEFAVAYQLIGELWLDDLRVSSFGSEALGGTVAERQGAFSTAIRRAIESADSDVERLRYEAFLAEGELRLRDALAKYSAYTAALPNDTEALSNLAQVALIAREYEVAVRALDRLIDIAPNELWSINRVVNGYFRALRPEKGAALARRLLELAPTQGQALYQAQRALLWNGETEAAAALLPRYLATQGEARAVGYHVARIRQACAENRREDALAIREEALRANSTPNWFFHIAAVLEPPEIAAEVLRPVADSGNAYGLANYLTYPHFDPRPFPELMQILLREGVTVSEPAPPPFACEPAEADSPKTVAVLPFVNLSADSDNEYFADGVAEEVLNLIARSEELRVISRSSAFSFKNQNVPIPEIAQRLGATHVLDGSIRRAGERVRVTAQLIDASSDIHLWSETFDRELTDIFAVQDEIAAAIAGALAAELSARPARSMAIEVYEMVLEARALASRRLDEAGLRRGVELLIEATRIAPENAEAWGQLALAQMLLSNWFDNTAEALERTGRYATEALALDPQNVAALTAMGAYELFSFEFEAAEAHFQRALTVNPNSVDAANWYGDFLLIVHRLDEALDWETLAARLDPLLAVHQLNIGFVHSQAGNIEGAV
ncbi:MAG: tetratricopeptide repeat protein, partial [Pseudomonadota bacterium]